MSLHDRCGRMIGKREGGLTGGEARTLSAVIHGIEPEEVESFVLISFAHCFVCGKHSVLLEKDMTTGQAIDMLASAIGVLSLQGGEIE